MFKFLESEVSLKLAQVQLKTFCWRSQIIDLWIYNLSNKKLKYFFKNFSPFVNAPQVLMTLKSGIFQRLLLKFIIQTIPSC